MAIINRISRLFKADFHAVLDQVEEPEVLLKQAVREMEDALLEYEQNIKRMELEQTRLLQRQADLEQFVIDTDDELALCFAVDNEDLARNLIRRKLESQRYLKTILRTRNDLEKSLQETRVQLKDDRAKYENMKQKSELLSNDRHDFTAYARDSVCMRDSEWSVAQDEVEVALLKEKHRFEQAGRVAKSKDNASKGAAS